MKLARTFGWTPDDIKRMDLDDRADYLYVLDVEERMEQS